MLVAGVDGLEGVSRICDTRDVDVRYTGVFEGWLRGLRDQRARAAIVARLRRIEDGNFGDHRSVAGGVSELRIHAGAGYRVYYTIRRTTIVAVLCGGTKASQQRDIRRAQQMAVQLEEGR